MSDVANFFDEIAAQQTPAPVRRKLEREVERAMKKRDAEKSLEDEGRQAKVFTAWKHAQRDALCNGPHGREVKGLITFMRTMTLSSAPALLGMVERATFWRSMSVDDRFALLGVLNSGIAACRVRNDLSPYDDPIPWVEAPKAYQKIKTMFELDGR
jgi:hypothetical protein